MSEEFIIDRKIMVSNLADDLVNAAIEEPNEIIDGVECYIPEAQDLFNKYFDIIEQHLVKFGRLMVEEIISQINEL